MPKSLQDQVAHLINISREDFKNVGGLFIKLAEEFGEFAETVNYDLGNLPHKTKPSEAPIGEAADVIICVLSILAKLNPTIEPAELTDQLTAQLIKKGDKYEQKVIQPTR